MIGDIPMVKKAQPSGERRLRVRFAGDRREYVLDLTGLIARTNILRRSWKTLTCSPRSILCGVAWPVETKRGHLDLSGSPLRRMAEEQLPMSGADFAKWRKSLGLSLTEAAKLLGVGRRTIMGYLKKDELPAVVAIACRALARDKHVFAAHYVPARKMSRHVG